MELTWTSEMSVGNEAMDSEHKALLDMVNDIERAIDKRNAVAFRQALLEFERSVRTHFRHEAKLALAIGHPFEAHELEHQYVLGELQTMMDELLSNEGRWSESAIENYYGFLSQWSAEHVGDDDMQMKAILITFPYDFKPPDLPE